MDNENSWLDLEAGGSPIPVIFTISPFDRTLALALRLGEATGGLRAPGSDPPGCRWPLSTAPAGFWGTNRMRAGPTWLALASWWLAAAAVAALLPVATAQGCTLTLPLNATASAISMNGSAVDTTKPLALRVDFVPAHPEAALGFEGALSLVLAGTDPCPTAAADVLPRLVGAQVQTTDTTGPLLLYPTGGIQVSLVPRLPHVDRLRVPWNDHGRAGDAA